MTRVDACNLHHLGNRVLTEVRSAGNGSATADRILAIVEEFEQQCDVLNVTADVVTAIKRVCGVIRREERTTLLEQEHDELKQLAEQLHFRHRQTHVRPKETSATQDQERNLITSSGPDALDIGKIPVTILLVDDNRTDVERTLDLFEEWKAQRLADDAFAFTVLSFPALTTTSRQWDSHFQDSNTFDQMFRCLLQDQVQQVNAKLQLKGRPIYGQEYSDALRHLQAVVLDYEIVCGGNAGSTTTGDQLAALTARFRPGVNRHLLTGVQQGLEQHSNLFHGVVWKGDLEVGEGDELFFAILRSIQSKLETPFWDALRSFAKRPIITCHAMALARARSARKGTTISDVVDFYDLNYFRAETSATLHPLDSLLHPTGSILEAQRHAAKAFGAWNTKFVTNGTSTANKIVLQALLKPGDPVLVDRNCHISHHYAIALSQARPYYVEPFQLPQYKIGGGIPLSEIEHALLSIWEKEQTLPKAILITNCTFDGIICNPKAIIERVRLTLNSTPDMGGDQRLSEIAFVFDEAWFAFARFHPEYVTRTAMAAAANLEMEDPGFYEKHLRVYVTQSTHKTLSAFRQGSMIHIRDPIVQRRDLYGKESDMMVAAIEQAFLTHTSTSPHNGIIASLDLARRQAELEGVALVGNALDLSKHLRSILSNPVGPNMSEFHHYFQVLDKSAMIPDTCADEFLLDSTKITVQLRGNVKGSEVRKALLDRYDIQFNKYSDNTILLMVTIGASLTTVENVKLALVDYAKHLRREGTMLRSDLVPTGSNEEKWIPDFSGFEDTTLVNDIGRFFFNTEKRPMEWCNLSECRGCNYPSATFVVPYPPGYPVLVPGQLIDDAMIEFLGNLSTEEIHGTKRDNGELSLFIFASR